MQEMQTRDCSQSSTMIHIDKLSIINEQQNLSK